MPESREKARARTKAHTAARKAQGWRRLSLFMEPDTFAAMERMRKATGETRVELLSRFVKEASGKG